jgi:hypothetical protein
MAEPGVSSGSADPGGFFSFSEEANDEENRTTVVLSLTLFSTGFTPA